MHRVLWEIDIDADTPVEAARKALAIHRDPESIATVFDVIDKRGKRVRVDLSKQEVTDVRVR
jgi:hypothetical protein